MEPNRDDQLIADLQALRPTPRPQFAAELDERAAAGFPRRSRLSRQPFDRLRAMQPRQLLIPVGGLAALAIALVTAISILSGAGSDVSSQPEHFASPGPRQTQTAGSEASAPSSSGAGAPSKKDGRGVQFESAPPA